MTTDFTNKKLNVKNVKPFPSHVAPRVALTSVSVAINQTTAYAVRP